MTDRRIYGAWVVGTAIIVLGALFGGCATLKADAEMAAKAVSEECGPEILPDALVIVPLSYSLADCEYRHEDCTVQRQQLQSAASAQVQACAVAVLHDQAVKLATADAGTP